MSRDPNYLAHKEWIGFVQPTGLVVSIPALIQAQAYIDRNVIAQHTSFVAAVKTNTGHRIHDFPALTRETLGWRETDLCGGPGAPPVPPDLEVNLVSYGEVLRPTCAVPDQPSADGKSTWIMLIQELPGDQDFDKVATADDRQWQASPHARLERLLRETGIPIGLLTNVHQIRLVYAPRGENSGHVTFSIADMVSIAGRPIFSAFHLLLNADRLFTEAPERRLPAILANSRKFQSLVSNQLSEQVLASLYELLRGFQAADDARHGDLLRDVLQDDPTLVYGGLLTVLMRLVFLLYAEDRDLISTDPIYVNHYSVSGLYDRLRADDGRYPDTMDQRFGAWAQLLTLFRLVYDGCHHGNLRVPARQGYLFDPDRYCFLEGRPHKHRREPGEQCPVPRVSDGVVYRVLRNLLMLGGERLSYRTLDVEQIGSVYERMMGFALEIAKGQSIAIKPAKSHGAPATINLDALLAQSPANRGKWLTEHTDQKLTGQAADALNSAATISDLLAALDRKIARTATPTTVPAGSMVLQPSGARRKSGSHYTPRSLTEPIVRKTLEPVLKRLGEHPSPAQILDLRVCDIAVGSGAFLVEACRQLGDALVEAWQYHKATPKIPPDEDELLFARRLVGQRCLYGVDKNPMAVDLAKLSLWLATLAKDHPFTFLDHSIRCGDSLVGLTLEQIKGFHWKPSTQREFATQMIDDRVNEVAQRRREILDADDYVPFANKQQKLTDADDKLNLVRFIGDLAVAAFFGGDKDRARQTLRDGLLAKVTAYLRAQDVRLRPSQAVQQLRSGDRPITPFHWEIEFPEVFGRAANGFDAVVGNPPFAGKNTLVGANHDCYLDWLKAVHASSHGNSDLVAHFFRRAFDLLVRGGSFGLIATNTIGQGDTRSTGLRWICTHGGYIYSARRRLKWPGQAAVVVSVVHASRGPSAHCELDGMPTAQITAYLFHRGGHDSPMPLVANAGRNSNGVKIYGSGFTFDDSDSSGTASPLSLLRQLLSRNSANGDVIFPYIGGEEVNDSPTHEHRRYVVSFGDMTEEQASQWPDVLGIVREKVKPERDQLSDERCRTRWWQFERPRADFLTAVRRHDRVLVCCRHQPHWSVCFLPSRVVCSDALVLFAFHDYAGFGVMQSRVHEVWARFFSGSMKDDLRYTPSDCFDTFPFLLNSSGNGTVSEVGENYYVARSRLMLQNMEGVTQTYNRFHDPAEQRSGVHDLRTLHDRMDRAVLDAYGWNDLSTVCGFGLDYLECEEDELPDDTPEVLWFPTAEEALAFAAKLPPTRRRLHWRYRWHDDIRDEVLARLLDLNQKRAEEERRTANTHRATGRARATRAGTSSHQSEGLFEQS